MSLSPEIAALAGASIGAIPGVVATIVNCRFEERRRRVELAVQAALERWRFSVVEARAQTHPDKGVADAPPKIVLPPEFFILHAGKMLDLAFRGKMSAASLAQELEEADEVMRVLREYAEKVFRRG